MLVALRIRHFVLIEELELRLEPGFNVITGETGAGKSILVDALSLVFGHRVGSDLVRPGADEAEVEALFDIPADSKVVTALRESGLGDEGELVIRRVVHRSGRSRAYVNGRLCSARELVLLSRELADVTSQHESVALVDPRNHLEYLDQFAGLGRGAAISRDRAELNSLVVTLQELNLAIATLESKERERRDREGFLRYQLESIEAVAPEADEHEALTQELERLRHGERLRGIAARAVALLEGEDGGLCDELGRVVGDLGAGAAIDPALRSAADELEGVWGQLGDLGRGLADYLDRLELDPARLEEVQARLYAIEKLARSHGPTIADVLLTRDRIQAELDAFESADLRLPELRQERAQVLGKAAVLARSLSKARRSAAQKLGEAVARELSDLGMTGANVVVEVRPTVPKAGEAEVDGARLGSRGIDKVELMLAPNPGVEPRPLGQIASGGELSRVLLGLRRALTSSGGARKRAGIVVLDEVDAGVGGETADRIGRAIASIARERQVLCITHLASIAAHADAHFVVEKRIGRESTTSAAHLVEGADRIAELARMLTGARNGATERAAKDLLGAARRSRARSPRAA